MQTLTTTAPQTLQAHAKKLHELAEWYATTAAAHALEAGRTHGPIKESNRISHEVLSSRATQLEGMATSLDVFMVGRREKANAPAITKDTKIFVTMQNARK